MGRPRASSPLGAAARCNGATGGSTSAAPRHLSLALRAAVRVARALALVCYSASLLDRKRNRGRHSNRGWIGRRIVTRRGYMQAQARQSWTGLLVCATILHSTYNTFLPQGLGGPRHAFALTKLRQCFRAFQYGFMKMHH